MVPFLMDKHMERINFATQYLSTTSFLRKLADMVLIASLIIVWGLATGKVPLPKMPTHTVKASFNTSRAIQKVLDIEQNKHQLNFVGNFRFNNGQQGLDGFPYIKYTLSEYSSALSVDVDTNEMQNIPIVSNMSMVGALVDNRCYADTPNPNSARFRIALQMNIKSYTACPVTDHRGSLIGFVTFASSNVIPPKVSDVQEAVKQVRMLQTKL